MFPSIEYIDRVSHFDPNSDYHDFRGFFVLFWIGLAIMVITSMLRNYKETGYPLQIKQWDLFKEKIWELGMVDGAMVFSTALSLPLQKLFLHGDGALRWNKLGIAIQSVYQMIWLLFWVTYVHFELFMFHTNICKVTLSFVTGAGLPKFSLLYIYLPFL